MRLPDPEQSRAIIVGTSRFDDPLLPELPSVLKGISRLSKILTDPNSTGLRVENCLVLDNESSVPIVGEHLEAFAAAAHDTLIVYYAGHGVLDRSGNLHLALTGTRSSRLTWTAIPISSIRSLIAESPAQNKVLMLDCCFSGRAIETMTDLQSILTAQVDVAGAYTLTSAPPNSPSFAPSQATYTAFTGELIQILQSGSPSAPNLLTLGEIYRLLHNSLARRGLPLPQQRNTQHAHLLALAPNRAKKIKPRTDFSVRYGIVWTKAQNGDLESMYHLGVLLRQDRLEDDAEAWLKEAARLDHSDAMIDLASIYEAAGKMDTAELYFRRAADEGGDHALVQAAEFLERRARPKSAIAYLRMSANLGNVDSMIKLARLLRRSDKEEEADHWLHEASLPVLHSGNRDDTQMIIPGNAPALIKRAKEAHDPALIDALASSMEWRRMANEAEFFYRRAAEQNYTEAQYHLALLLEDLRRSDESENWYRTAAENGHAEAMYRLGAILHRRGATAGEEWLKRSSDAGNIDGMFALGMILAQRQDHTAADALFERAAVGGHAAAMNALGLSLANRDPELAKIWYQKASRLGNVAAMNNLGLLLLNDDIEAARASFVRAAQHGNNIARENLKHLPRYTSG
jgi:TPR repeat protein